jgi:4a-hydroxytetrahydrobiopterin dehydratase
MSDLASRSCIPCRGGIPPLTPEQQAPLQAQLDAQWKIVNGHHLSRSFRLKNFAQGLAFVNRIGEMAEAQGHHPDLYLAWGEVRVEVWTHKIDGLQEADFIFAAKVDQLRSEL